jgi:hypothetical protein
MMPFAHDAGRLLLLTVAPSSATEIAVLGVSFSDEEGGFTLKGVTGSGTVQDPFIVVEEIFDPRQAVLVIRGMRHFGNRVGGLQSFAMAMRKIVINRTSDVWRTSNWNCEVPTRHSPYEDGLSLAEHELPRSYRIPPTCSVSTAATPDSGPDRGPGEAPFQFIVPTLRRSARSILPATLQLASHARRLACEDCATNIRSRPSARLRIRRVTSTRRHPASTVRESSRRDSPGLIGSDPGWRDLARISSTLTTISPASRRGRSRRQLVDDHAISPFALGLADFGRRAHEIGHLSAR